VISLSKSQKLEQQIERIHQLLQQKDSVVTWNDKIPDPDNLDQPRQIDVTIRRDSKLTLVECRVHNTKQDVNWIEELIGRRQSLRADSVIAVSASGFTKGAIKKAAQFGIVLRDFISLSPDEIQSWGKVTRVAITYFEFTNFILTFTLPSPCVTPHNVTDISGKPIVLPIFVTQLFQVLMDKLDRNKQLGSHNGTVDAKINADVLVNGLKPTSLNVTAKVRRIVQKRELVAVLAYKAPDALDATEAHVEKFDLGNSEVIKTSANRASFIFDLSQLDHPPNSAFYTIMVDLGEVMTVSAPEFIGLDSMIKITAPIRLQFTIHQSNNPVTCE
jgi:hypothetical protein